MLFAGRRASVVALLLVSLLALPAGSCADEDEPGCFATQETSLPVTPLTSSTNARLHRTEAGFALLADDGPELRWGVYGPMGTLFEQASPAPPRTPVGDRVAGPWTALLGKSTPGDQLALAYVARRTDGQPGHELLLLVQERGGTALPPRRLAELPDSIPPQDLLVSARSFPSGRRAALAFGRRGERPALLVLDPDGAPRPAGTLPAAGECLSLTPGREGRLAAAVLEREAGEVFLAMTEVLESAVPQATYRLPLDMDEASCPEVSPAARGYALAWLNPDGLFFAQFDKRSTVSHPTLVAGAVRFGGPQHLPTLLGLATTGRDFVALLARPRDGRSELWRIDPFGRRRGAALRVPGRAPTLAGDGTGQVHLSEVSTSAAAEGQFPRRLSRLECPGGGSATSDAARDTEGQDAGSDALVSSEAREASDASDASDAPDAPAD